MNLKDQTAIVTGGSRGIGRAICIKLASLGANIVTCYARGAEAADETVKACEDYGVKSLADQAYVSKAEDVDRLFEEGKKLTGSVEILVNNAGITRDNLIIRLTDEDFEQVMNTNLKGSFYAMRAAAKLMMRKRYGRIVNLSSIVGIYGNAGQVNYAASKAGVIGMTRSFARELGSRGITCNAVAPGFIRTDMTDILPEETKAELAKQIPLGRIGTPEDVANAVAFLVSEEAAYITAQVIEVSGGMM
ncbi:MAG: 3-oxoacyl-[acyl-carrier-protein] reductase [Lachnospiraceae bacterium]|nr:3-oxoacyl-[acyl-carrier-protein] reductase [Lachnospiraceae bacterium]